MAMSVQEAGRRGGLKGGKKGGDKVKADRGIEFYQAIGRKGGRKVRAAMKAAREPSGWVGVKPKATDSNVGEFSCLHRTSRCSDLKANGYKAESIRGTVVDWMARCTTCFPDAASTTPPTK